MMTSTGWLTNWGCEDVHQIGFASDPAHLNLDIVCVCPSEFAKLSLQRRESRFPYGVRFGEIQDDAYLRTAIALLRP